MRASCLLAKHQDAKARTVRAFPFSGDQSGKNFERFLASINLQRSEIFITSAALCNPRATSGANRRPKASEIRNCSSFLRRTIDLIEPAVIVTLGTVALDALKLLHYHEFNLKNDAGRIRSWDNRMLVPVYHPSPQVLITSRDESAQLEDYEVVAEAIRGSGIKANTREPNYLINRILRRA
jgi:DNA polymerase